jgi:hypothetical protein
VRVRRGLEEPWSPAAAGTALKPLDTVWCGEASEAVLALEDGTRFTLGGNAMLDASDLRRITERQLFLYMMSRKIGRLTGDDSSGAIHIANVSVVRGSPAASQVASTVADPSAWTREKNGARALLSAGFATNAAMKLYRILERHPEVEDQGELHACLGQAFETLNQPGRAIEAYQTALERISGNAPPVTERRTRMEAALVRLKAGR